MKRKLLLGFVMASLAFTACKKSGDNAGSKTHMSVRMTDAPGAYDAVILSVKEIVVLSAGGESHLAVNGKPINILNFRLGKDTLLAAQDVPAGRLQEVRLVLNDSGNRVVVNGVSHDLKTPSGQTSGVKLKVQDDLKAGIAYTLLLDFDAAKSIVTTGNGKYILKPVIRAIPQEVSGAMVGVVVPAASSPMVYAINGTDTVGTVTDATGKFYFPGLASGTYKIDFVPISPFLVKSIDNVVIANGAVKDVGVVTITQ
jgi:hypothetical protein